MSDRLWVDAAVSSVGRFRRERDVGIQRAKVSIVGLNPPQGWNTIGHRARSESVLVERGMEELNQVAGEGLCRESSLYPPVFGSMLAATIALVLALCLGYL